MKGPALFAVLLLLASVPFFQAGTGETTPGPRNFVRDLTHTEWLILVYIAGDNDLGTDGEYGNAAVMDIEEMERSIPDSGVRILALTDLLGPSNTVLYDIRPDQDPGIDSPSIPLSEMDPAWTDEVNMGDEVTLEKFMVYALTNYSYDRSMFIMWDHGSGWYFESDISRPPSTRGFAQDVESGSLMYLDDMREAFISTEDRIGHFRFDIIGHDTCYMGMIEVFYQFARWTSIAVGSMDEQPWYGYNYTFISTLSGTGPHLPRDLALDMIDYFSVEYSSSSSTYHTIAAADITILSNEFLDSWERLSASLYYRMYNLEVERSGTFSKVEMMTEAITIDNIDIGSFLLELMNGGLGTNLTELANETLAIYNEMLIGSWIKPEGRNPKGTGISVYMPNKELPYKTQYDGSRGFLNFTADTSWDEMIREYRDPVERLRLELTILENSTRSAIYDLQVKVTDPRNTVPVPVQGARVSINDIIEGETDSDGIFLYPDIEPGRYRVEAMKDRLVDVEEIKALNRAPVAVIGPENLTVGEGFTLRLNSTGSYDPDGDLLRYVWDTDDLDGLNDTDHTTPFVNFIRHDEGIYGIRLTVNDSELSDVREANITVINLDPIPEVTGPDAVFEDQEFILDGSNTTDSIMDVEELEYRFSLEQNILRDWSTAPMASMSVRESGYYLIRMEAKDRDGGYAFTDFGVDVLNRLPVPIMNGPSVLVEDEVAIFYANASYDTPSDMKVLSYRWYVGGDADPVSEDEVLSLSFREKGEYTLRLEVFDGNPLLPGTEMNWTSRTITVNNRPPIARFETPAMVDESTMIKLNGSFSRDTSSDLGGLTYRWLIDGGDIILEGIKNDISFDVPGIHTITLEVKDSDGDTGLLTKNIMVRNVRPEIRFNITGNSWEDQPLDIVIEGPIDTPNDMDGLEATWKLGDDTIVKGLQRIEKDGMIQYHAPDIISHSSGNFTLKAIVKDDQLEVGQYSINITILNPEPNVVLSGIPKNIGVGEKITAYGHLSTDNPSDMDTILFIWLVDGKVQEGKTEKNATFEFDSGGERTITLRLIDDDGAQREVSLTVMVEERSLLSRVIGSVFSVIGLLLILIILALIIILIARLNGKMNELRPPNREKQNEEEGQGEDEETTEEERIEPVMGPDGDVVEADETETGMNDIGQGEIGDITSDRDPDFNDMLTEGQEMPDMELEDPEELEMPDLPEPPDIERFEVPEMDEKELSFSFQ